MCFTDVKIRLFVSMSLVFSLAACGDDDDGAAGDPSSGIWNYADNGIQDNTCGTDDVYSDPDTTFELSNKGNGTFTVDYNTDALFECTLSGSSFECPERLYSEIPVPSIGVTLKYQASIKGTFSSDTRASGTQRMDITCEGAGCNLAGTLGYTLPCYYTADFTATKQ